MLIRSISDLPMEVLGLEKSGWTKGHIASSSKSDGSGGRGRQDLWPWRRRASKLLDGGFHLAAEGLC